MSYGIFFDFQKIKNFRKFCNFQKVSNSDYRRTWFLIYRSDQRVMFCHVWPFRFSTSWAVENFGLRWPDFEFRASGVMRLVVGKNDLHKKSDENDGSKICLVGTESWLQYEFCLPWIMWSTIVTWQCSRDMTCVDSVIQIANYLLTNSHTVFS